MEREVNINMQGVGLSLVNDILRKEIAYVSISRSRFLSSLVEFQNKHI